MFAVAGIQQECGREIGAGVSAVHAVQVEADRNAVKWNITRRLLDLFG